MRIRNAVLFSVLVLLITGSVYWIGTRHPDDQLSSDQIHGLRQQYPQRELYPSEIEGHQAGLDEVVNFASAYIIAEVVGREQDQILNLDMMLSEEEIEKYESMGIIFNNSIGKIRVRVVETIFSDDFLDRNIPIKSTLKIHEGQDIVLSYSKMLEMNLPEMEPGTLLLLPILSGVDQEEVYDYSFIREGSYYIVNEKYVLSAFSEPVGSQYSGKTLNWLKQEILHLRNK